jgi:hypothetical protein
VSFKTDRLAALLPDAYAAGDQGSLLYRVLDAFGFELMEADESVKALLKSHWVNYAVGDALDGLAATFGLERRRLPDGTLEPDEVLQARLKAVVPYFTGGGTVKAVLGAVRSALGLPFDLELFRREAAGPAGDPTGEIDALVRALEDLVQIEEFSPKPETALSVPVTTTGETSEVTVEVGFSSVEQAYPRIEWTFTRGGGRFLTLQRLDSGAGIKSDAALRVNPGETLVLTADGTGALSASIGTTDVTARFKAWDGVSAPRLPDLPVGLATQWKLTAKAGTFGTSTFDDTEGYDTPLFSVRFSWVRRLPLTFDVVIPYFLPASIKEAKTNIFFWEGLPRDVFQKVVDQTRAAGVRGNVHFSLRFTEDHAAEEQLAGLLEHRIRETQDVKESMAVGSVNTATEDQRMDESFAVGGVFDVSRFDGSTGFNSQ